MYVCVCVCVCNVCVCVCNVCVCVCVCVSECVCVHVCVCWGVRHRERTRTLSGLTRGVQPSAFLCNGESIGPHAKIDGRVDFQDGVGYEWGVKITGNRGMQTKKLTL